MLKKMHKALKRNLPKSIVEILLVLSDLKDAFACAAFLFQKELPISFLQRWQLIRSFYRISARVDSPHTQREILAYVKTILSIPNGMKGVVVEAGCFKGSSTAKFSLAADLADRELVVCDSFEGIPENEEEHGRDIFGKSAGFAQGTYRGGLDEVKANVSQFGKISCCRFIKGWFDDTLPQFNEPVAAAYLDVDLVSSTKTCIQYFYPLLQSGGALFSQDGHLPLIIQLFQDKIFWQDEIGITVPMVYGLNQRKLIHIRKS
ncbi:class I SAM-dependent methyltransferase [candidate division KSB1 bacterium]|nr:class I SAM-dependent methyltransferase [candidate division KSB1 bacterium]